MGALALIVLAGSMLLALAHRAHMHRLAATGDTIAVAAARADELRRVARQRDRLATVQHLGEDAVEDTTRTVQEIHRGIASIPFGVLEAIPATRDTTRIVREVHDLTSDSVYGTIRGINRLIGAGLRRGLHTGDTPPTGKRKDR